MIAQNHFEDVRETVADFDQAAYSFSGLSVEGSTKTTI